ncbi:cytochrome p450 domain-containing protein [Ditylenchus destructor]|uniref:Cytochrome p450 domain-containing protein n=1 Tax=Ditylenchus destructor TaxID=166010 RepID=A0AAD4N526_9BILA|nr:cytochrome p450 domain-containing protein [Ditylenchus destructor]
MVVAIGEKLSYLILASLIAVKLLPLYWSIVVTAGIFAAFYGAYTFGRIELVTQDLEILRHVLVKDFECFTTRPDIFRFSFGSVKESIATQTLSELEGEEWRRVRYAVTPAFTSLKMRTIIPILNVCCKELEKFIDNYVESNEPIPLKDVLGRMTLDMIAKAGFALDVNTYDRIHESPFVYHSKEFFKDLKFVGLRTFLFPKEVLVLVHKRTSTKEEKTFTDETHLHKGGAPSGIL